MTSSQPDPFTIEIIKDSLVGISEEMFAVMTRTAKSPIIYEVLDGACGLVDNMGRLLTQGNGLTGFLGVLPFAAKHALAKFGPDGLADGDIVIVNDPYFGGGTHLNDVVLVAPIFVQDELLAFSVAKAHWTEVGGKDPGSISTDAESVYQEGLCFPCIKIFEAGEPVTAIFDLIEANVRLPDMSLGDVHAEAAALRLGGQRFVRLCERYGVEIVRQSIRALLDHGERHTRLRLRELPVGTYTATDVIDDDGLGNGPFPIKVTVTVTEDEFVCDFTGSAGQAPGPVNCTEPSLHSGVRTVFKALIDPETPANEGCFQPVRVVCEPGTIFTVQRPAPVSTYYESMIHVTDLLWKALAPLLPDHVTAGQFLSPCVLILAGVEADSGELFLHIEPNVGGWGAGPGKDGENGLMSIGNGETYNVPAEVVEARSPIRLERYEFDITDGGAGRHRGGRGCVREFRPHNDVTMTVVCGRYETAPWSAEGAHDGSTNRVEVVRSDGRTEQHSSVSRLPVRAGELVRVITGTGGGWGDPLHRPVDMVVRDARDGYITTEQAERDYGVLLDSETLQLRGVSSARD